jgi:hypothetical protein
MKLFEIDDSLYSCLTLEKHEINRYKTYLSFFTNDKYIVINKSGNDYFVEYRDYCKKSKYLNDNLEIKKYDNSCDGMIKDIQEFSKIGWRKYE